MVSIIGIIGTFPIAIVFGICFVLILKSYFKNPNRTKIFFMIWTIATAMTYLNWGLRVLFIPQFESNQTVLYPFWAISYGFGATALIAIAFASLDQTKMKESVISIIIRIVIIATYALVMIILLIGGFEQELVIFMDVTDMNIENQFVFYYFTILILFYIFFPNALYIVYLIKSSEKDTFTYKRVRIIEIGILIWSICILLDGMRFPSNMGILIIRIILMIGGLITMKGFLMKTVSD